MFWRTQAQKRQPPGSIEPCIPTAALKPPIGPQWIHEIKHDGYRLIVRKKDDRVGCSPVAVRSARANACIGLRAAISA